MLCITVNRIISDRHLNTSSKTVAVEAVGDVMIATVMGVMMKTVPAMVVRVVFRKVRHVLQNHAVVKVVADRAIQKKVDVIPAIVNLVTVNNVVREMDYD